MASCRARDAGAGCHQGNHMSSAVKPASNEGLDGECEGREAACGSQTPEGDNSSGGGRDGRFNTSVARTCVRESDMEISRIHAKKKNTGNGSS